MEKQYIFFDTPAGCRAGVIASVAFIVAVALVVSVVHEPLWLFGVVVLALASIAASTAMAVDRRAIRRMPRRHPPPP